VIYHELNFEWKTVSRKSLEAIIEIDGSKKESAGPLIEFI